MNVIFTIVNLKKLSNTMVYRIDNYTNINSLSRSDTIEFNCVKCGILCIINSFRKSRIERYKSLLCETCYRKNKSIEKWGTEYPQQSEEVKHQTINTNISRYGKPNINTFGSEEWYTNMLKKHGVKYSQQSKIIQNTTKNNNLEKYGVDHWSKSKDHDNRISEIVDKCKRTNFERYGTDSYSKTKEFIEKKKQTSIEKFGVPYYQQTIESRKFRKGKYVYNFENFDSIPELCYYIYMIETGHYILRDPCCFEYSVNEITHKYFPDFVVDGYLVEIKGNHFINDDGILFNPYDNTQNEIYKEKQKCAISNSVTFVFTNSYIIQLSEAYVKRKYGNNYLDLFRVVKNETNIYFMQDMNQVWLNPYNFPKNEKYIQILGFGTTPFDGEYYET